jgi:hypothetical protein
MSYACPFVLSWAAVTYSLANQIAHGIIAAVLATIALAISGSFSCKSTRAGAVINDFATGDLLCISRKIMQKDKYAPH